MRRGNRQRLPESLALGDPLGHGSGVPRQVRNWSEASAHINHGDSGGEQQADGKQDQNDPPKGVQHPVGAKRGNSDGKKTLLVGLLKRNNRNTTRLFSTANGHLKG